MKEGEPIVISKCVNGYMVKQEWATHDPEKQHVFESLESLNGFIRYWFSGCEHKTALGKPDKSYTGKPVWVR